MQTIYEQAATRHENMGVGQQNAIQDRGQRIQGLYFRLHFLQVPFGQGMTLQVGAKI